MKKRSHFWFCSFPRQFVRLLRNKKLYDIKESYYPELEHKSKCQIFCDQFKHLLKYHHIESNYFLYGFDVKNFRRMEDYLDYGRYVSRRDYLNNHPSSKEVYSYTGILRDKFYFAIFMETLGFRVPKTYGLLDKNGLFSIETHKTLALSELSSENVNLFCKPFDGIGGVGIFSLQIHDNDFFCDGVKVSLEQLQQKIGNARFFVQATIEEQHPLMKSLYPKAINTLRVTTVRDPKTGKIEIIGCMLLMGARDAVVSNWHYGGVIINVESDGHLGKYGFSLYEKKITQHPETGVVFEQFQVPFFDLAISEAKRCHDMFYGIHSVGWDFAVLPDGVMFIEGNDNWGMAAHQMVGGGLQKKFNQYFL